MYSYFKGISKIFKMILSFEFFFEIACYSILGNYIITKKICNPSTLMISFILNSFHSFWKRHPALLYGFSMLIGFSLILTENVIFSLPALLLLLSGKRALFAYPLMITSMFFAHHHFIAVKTSHDDLKGTAHFEIRSIATKATHFGKHVVYRGVIKSLIPHATVKNIPVSISIPLKKEITRPPANKAYLLEGHLKELGDARYIFVLEKNKPWEAIENSWSFAEIRFALKKHVMQYIHKKIDDSESATFLSGIATGEFDDQLMLFHFSRFGLQHIMAISGFHFAIIAGFLRLMLQLIFSKKTATYLLLLLLTTYFMFLGFGPSVLRAWLMILIVLIGYLLQKSSIALNSMGVALITLLIIDPLMIRHIGFQFSFLTTASILMFYSGSDKLLQQLFFKRPLKETVEMNSLNQHGFIVLTAIRQSIALCLAVNLTAIPLMLYHFEQFPYLSIIYNFFFPFMVSISMLLLILGLMIPIFPFIHGLNSAFTQFLLRYTYNMPQTADYKLVFQNFALEPLIIYLCLIFCAGLFFNYYLELKKEERLDFEYL